MTRRAACEVAVCGLLRVSEYCVKGGKGVDEDKLPLVRDVTFSRDAYGTKATLMMSPSKKGARAPGKRVPVELRDGDVLRPVQALRRMLRARQAKPDEPLFVLKGAPLVDKTMSSLVKSLMAAVGEDSRKYSSHSLRITGATAALVAGLPHDVIN